MPVWGLCSGLEQPRRPSFGESALELMKRAPGLRSTAAQTSPLSQGDSPSASDQAMCTLDNLIHEVATPRTRATLEEYDNEFKVCALLVHAPCPT